MIIRNIKKCQNKVSGNYMIINIIKILKWRYVKLFLPKIWEINRNIFI